MVDTASIETMEIHKGEGMLSAADAIREWGITKMTFFKWMVQKKIKVKRYKFGSRVVLALSAEEVSRVKNLMVKKREAGKSLFK